MGAVLTTASWISTTRLSLHVLAACVWIGGQLVLAGLLPTIRGLGDTAPRQVAQAFGRLSWPAYWVLIATGVWNDAALHGDVASSAWNTTFAIKLFCVGLSGLGAVVHTRARSPRVKGLSAGIGTLAGLAALILGVALAG